MEDYRTVNRASWDERAPAHAASPDYFFDRFIDDPGYVSDPVRFDVPRLGEITGLRGVHLQCHIGTDTLSLARLGARMSGLDFSPASLEQARRLASATGTEIEYVQAEVYDAVAALGGGRFDLVYTGNGALCWLPEIDRWAQVVADLLAPGGRLFMREIHPMLWALADTLPDGMLHVDFPYFERSEPMVFELPGTYVRTDAVLEAKPTHEWNHGIGEVVTALLARGMQITCLVEHDSVPYDAFPGHMDELELGEYRLSDRPWRLAHSYTIVAVKQAQSAA